MAFGTSLLGGIAGGATVAITIKAIDNFSSTFNSAEMGLGRLGSVAKIGVAAIVGFGVALTAVGVSSIKVAADFEQTQIAFTTMLGSAQEADKFLKQLADFAKKTPFTLQGVERSARQLMAVGFEAKDVLPVLKNVGDLAAGLGMGEEGLQRLILNLGQVQAQGKLTGRELRDFAVAGIPLIDELAKHFGTTTEAVQEMVSAGEVKTADVLAVFESMTSEGGRFADLMTKQAETVEGKFSNLKDTITLMQREIGEALLPTVSALADTFLNQVLPAIEPMIPSIQDFLINLIKLIPPITELVVKLLPVFDFFVKVLSKGVYFLGQGIDAVQVSFQGWKLLLSDIISVIKTVVDWVKTLVGWIKDLVEWIGKISFGALSKVADYTGISTMKKIIVGDAIIKPGGQIIETSPQDTLIATKTPEMFGGGGLTIIIKDNNIYGTDPDDIAEALQDKLKTLIVT